MIDPNTLDAALHQMLSLFRFSSAEIAATMRKLKSMEKAIVAELLKSEMSKATKAEVKQLIANAENLIKEHYDNIQGSFDFEKLGRTVAQSTGKSLGIFLGKEAASVPTQAYFKSLMSNVLIKGAPSAEWWKAQAKDTSFKFAQQVRQGLANSETNAQIVRRIVGTKGVPGIMDVSRRNAASLVHTSVQAVANDARLATFRANDDVINGLMQVSTLDSHTTDICIAYANAEWDLDGTPRNGAPAFNGGPPRHFNCRSVLVPITKTFKELGVDTPETKVTTRASDEGQISAKTTFDTFLKRKGETYQDEMLGKGRADLWRSGKITLRDLVDGKGRPLTLEQLQANI